MFKHRIIKSNWILVLVSVLCVHNLKVYLRSGLTTDSNKKPPCKNPIHQKQNKRKINMAELAEAITASNRELAKTFLESFEQLKAQTNKNHSEILTVNANKPSSSKSGLAAFGRSPVFAGRESEERNSSVKPKALEQKEINKEGKN